MKFQISIFLMLISAILISSCSAAPTASPEAGISTLKLDDCRLTATGFENAVRARCGAYSVAEDRTKPDGRKIALNIAVIPAVSRNPQPDPLFILAGGPGQAAVELGPAFYYAFTRIHQERDIVLVDQRGTGKSNPLRCELPEDSDASISEKEVIQIMKDCPAKLDADLRFYTTPIAMQDLDEVRAALGYTKINIYGGSYGTRAALAYLRQFPNQVRAVVLDSVVSPDYVLFLNTPRDAQRALDLMFTRCSQDQACQAAFPDLRAEYDSVIQKLASQDVPVQITHPLTGKPLKFTLTQSIFTSAVFNLLYSTETTGLLPLDIHQAAEEENFAPLFTQSMSMDSGLYNGMFYSVACSEDAPLIQPEQAKELAQDTSFPDMTQAIQEICSIWPKTDLPADFRAPLTGVSTPVLILSGEADPVTPPQYAEAVAKMLPDSLLVTVPAAGHGIASIGCCPRLVADFIQNGATSGLDTSCVQKIKPSPFFIDFTGSKP